MQILRKYHGLAHADEFIVQILRHQRRCTDAEQPHGVRMDDAACRFLNAGVVQQLDRVLDGTNAAGLYGLGHLSHGVIVAYIGKKAGVLPLDAGVFRFIQLVEQGFFHIFQPIKADAFAQAHPRHLRGVCLLGQLGDGHRKYAVHIVQKKCCCLFFAHVQILVQVAHADFNTGHVAAPSLIITG